MYLLGLIGHLVGNRFTPGFSLSAHIIYIYTLYRALKSIQMIAGVDVII